MASKNVHRRAPQAPSVGTNAAGCISASVNEVKALPTGAMPNMLLEAVDPEDDNFARGRDLAAAMLKASEALWNTDDAAELRWHRDGRAQHRFATAYLSKLSEEPSLINGFSAVLSARLGTSDAIPASAFFGLPRAEFEAGPLGDGETAVEADRTSCEASVPVRRSQ